MNAQNIQKLLRGETVEFRPSGKSMSGRVEHRQLVTVEPIADKTIKKDDIVLCKVNGRVYLHLVKAVGENGNRFLIGNNHGKLNGWTSRDKIYGICTKVQ